MKSGRPATCLLTGALLLTACGSTTADRAARSAPATSSPAASPAPPAASSSPTSPTTPTTSTPAATQPATPAPRGSSRPALPGATTARGWTTPSSATTPPSVTAPPKPAAAPAGLPVADTYGRVDTAVDLTTSSNGNVAGFGRTTTAYRTPGGPAVARIPATQLGLPTWLPVIGRQAGWLQVRLPTRPNGAVAWVQDAGVTLRHTNWRVQVSLSANTITVYDGSRRVGSWPAGKGLPATPTPVGQTFLLTTFDSPPGSYTPSTFVLGVHSDTLDTYGGGPGTVAVHGWPTAAGRVGAVSHGCVRVPQATLDAFHKLPLGTPVDIAR
ncbi:L,D-transpeptidase [Flexivirga sp. ID2601S]|uniref:L,D-transpeptidase n=1 Tax=Flexivirga aerilata TaxID=1656889 RepID=A0A849AH45_9MICO|nr:L,D-transpeptidase [Flexivirga aerilata]NNG38601.1 L,D-transpeptidase [Flexivirga aerilata]